MKVIFVDNHLLVVDKPAGIPTQNSFEPGLEELAKAWIKKTYAKPGLVFLEPVHRLDKSVSGLVLFARTSKALARLHAQMREGKIRKTYYALVEGTLPKEEGDLEHYLIHGPFKALVSTADHPEAKRALLHYRAIDKNRVEISLHTGRYHQIRAQFAAIGCPIVGDVKYGSTTSHLNPGIALHHGRLEFTHPISKEPLIFPNL